MRSPLSIESADRVPRFVFARSVEQAVDRSNRSNLRRRRPFIALAATKTAPRDESREGTHVTLNDSRKQR